MVFVRGRLRLISMSPESRSYEGKTMAVFVHFFLVKKDCSMMCFVCEGENKMCDAPMAQPPRCVLKMTKKLGNFRHCQQWKATHYTAAITVIWNLGGA